jgi:hypothetical protein
MYKVIQCQYEVVSAKFGGGLAEIKSCTYMLYSTPAIWMMQLEYSVDWTTLYCTN